MTAVPAGCRARGRSSTWASLCVMGQRRTQVFLTVCELRTCSPCSSGFDPSTADCGDVFAQTTSVGEISMNVIRRLWNSLKNEVVQPDPWEPELAIGRIMLREKVAGQITPGRMLGIFDSQQELADFIASKPPMASY